MREPVFQYQGKAEVPVTEAQAPLDWIAAAVRPEPRKRAPSVATLVDANSFVPALEVTETFDFLSELERPPPRRRAPPVDIATFVRHIVVVPPVDVGFLSGLARPAPRRRTPFDSSVLIEIPLPPAVDHLPELERPPRRRKRAFVDSTTFVPPVPLVEVGYFSDLGRPPRRRRLPSGVPEPSVEPAFVPTVEINIDWSFQAENLPRHSRDPGIPSGAPYSLHTFFPIIPPPPSEGTVLFVLSPDD